MTEITLLFASVERRAREIVTFVDALPRLCRGALAECDLGTSSGGDHLVCVAYFRGGPPVATARRLDFWAWQLGGTASRGARQGLSALRACDLVRRAIPVDELSGTVRRLLEHRVEVGPPEPEAKHLPLRLSLGPGGRDADGLAFERSGREFFVPSPRLPPLGEPMVLELRVPGGGTLEVEGLVTGIRRAGQAGLGMPAGFLVGLVAPSDTALKALDEVPEGPMLGRRRAPRYPVRALAKLSSGQVGGTSGFVMLTPGEARDATPTCVENLSQGGAFVRTSAPAPMGTRVRLQMDLPGGLSAEVPGAVVYADERGVGIRFDGDPQEEAAIASAVEHVAVHRRRALIVDDDLLTRRMMGDALAAQGFEVFAAVDGNDGLRTLIDLLLDLDLVLIDLHMPGMNGEELIRLVRGQGGERELTVVVMSGDAQPGLRERLTAAGADAVLLKSEGMAIIAEVAVRTLLRRERSHRAGGRAASTTSLDAGSDAI